MVKCSCAGTQIKMLLMVCVHGVFPSQDHQNYCPQHKASLLLLPCHDLLFIVLKVCAAGEPV